MKRAQDFRTAAAEPRNKFHIYGKPLTVWLPTDIKYFTLSTVIFLTGSYFYSFGFPCFLPSHYIPPLY